MAGLTRDGHLRGELLSAYLDGELLRGELEIVVEHLTACEACIAEFRGLKEARSWLRTLPELELPRRALESIHFGPELSAYLDGELGTAEIRQVTTHLETCGYCRDELQELDSARTAVRSLPRLEPPVRFPPLQDRRAHQPRWRIASVAAGVAAAAVIAVGVASIRSEPVADIDLDSFADRHVARASVEPGFAVIPAVGPSGGGP